MQDLSANYHIVLAKDVSHVCTRVDGGHWIDFGHFETHMVFLLEGKKSAMHSAMQLRFFNSFFKVPYCLSSYQGRNGP